MPYDEAGNRGRIAKLRAKGVDVWGAERVYVGADVHLDRIEAGSEIRRATLAGGSLRIARGAKIGASGHALVEDCQIGRGVTLGAGSYQGATLLAGARVRGFAELRPGTLLEEEAEAAHSAAFKNTILTAGCVAGSVINFCDLFMSGGASRDDHSKSVPGRFTSTSTRAATNGAVCSVMRGACCCARRRCSSAGNAESSGRCISTSAR